MTRGGSRILLLLAIAGCGGSRPPLAPAPAAGPGGVAIAPGLTLRHVDDPTGPWAIDVLEADLTACWRAVALKAAGQAIGRERTSALARALADTGGVMVGGAVNADFFRFDPPGVPTGPHLSAGRLIVGPGSRPAVWFTDDGTPLIGALSAGGRAVLGGDTVALSGWNRPDGGGAQLVDAHWGAAVSRPAGGLAVVLGGADGAVQAVEGEAASVPVPVDGVVLLVDSLARRRLDPRLAPGAPASWRVDLSPAGAVEAVGGFPVLVRDSQVVAGLDEAGGRGFGPVRHPRTAIAVAARGSRLLLVTVDGRREGWSAGMTLAELADLLRSLGATEALNLDGGGSTTMVASRSGRLAVVNRPSDATGERPVGNALAVVRRCD